MTKKKIAYGLLSLFLLITLLAGCGGGNGVVSDVTNGLVLYYPLNGNGVDAVGDNDGVVTGTLTFVTDRFGNSNKACFFDHGTEPPYTNFIDIPSFSLAPDTTGFTVSMWIKINTSVSPPAPPVYGSLFYFRQDGTDLRFGVDPGDSPLTIDGSITLNQWIHIAGTYNDASKNGIFYINGEPVNSGTKVNNVSSWLINGLQLGVSWPGVIDDFRIYSRTLTASEINQLYHYQNN